MKETTSVIQLRVVQEFEYENVHHTLQSLSVKEKKVKRSFYGEVMLQEI